MFEGTRNPNLVHQSPTNFLMNQDEILYGVGICWSLWTLNTGDNPGFEKFSKITSTFIFIKLFSK